MNFHQIDEMFVPIHRYSITIGDNRTSRTRMKTYRKLYIMTDILSTGTYVIEEFNDIKKKIYSNFQLHYFGNSSGFYPINDERQIINIFGKSHTINLNLPDWFIDELISCLESHHHTFCQELYEYTEINNNICKLIAQYLFVLNIDE